MSLELTPGTTCLVDDRVIQIDGAESLTHMRVRDMGTGNLLTVPIAKIQALATQARRGAPDSIPESEWKRCAALASELGKLGTQQRVDREVLAKIGKRLGCSLRTVQRARAALLKDPRATALVRNQRGPQPGTSRLAPAMDTLIRHTIQKFYLKRERPTKAYVVARAQSLARRLGLKPVTDAPSWTFLASSAQALEVIQTSSGLYPPGRDVG